MCGQQWKSCNCRVWDEARLLQRARLLAPNFMPAAPAQPPVPAGPAQGQAGAAYQAPQRQPVDVILEQTRQREAQTEAAVQRAMQHVRNNHECRHEAFKSYYAPGGPGEWLDCEVCGDQYRSWLKQCKQCLMLVCVRCRHNRL